MEKQIIKKKQKQPDFLCTAKDFKQHQAVYSKIRLVTLLWLLLGGKVLAKKMYGYASTSEILGWILGNWLHLDNLLKVGGRFTKWGKITCDHNPPLAFIGILWGIYKGCTVF